MPTALLQASMVRLARAESLGDLGAGRAVVTGSLALSLTCGAAICLLLVGTAGPLAGVFLDDSAAGIAAAGIALNLLVLLAVMEFIVNPGLAAAGLLRGRKDTRAPMLYVLVGYWAVGAPLGLALCELRGLGVTGLWIGLAAGAAVTTALTLVRLTKFRPGADAGEQGRP